MQILKGGTLEVNYDRLHGNDTEDLENSVVLTQMVLLSTHCIFITNSTGRKVDWNRLYDNLDHDRNQTMKLTLIKCQ